MTTLFVKKIEYLKQIKKNLAQVMFKRTQLLQKFSRYSENIFMKLVPRIAGVHTTKEK